MRASFALRQRWLLCGLLLVIAAVLARQDPSPDLKTFARYGDLMMSGHLSQVYSDSFNQSGPIQLFVAWLIYHGGQAPPLAFELLVDLALLWLVYRVSRRFGVSPAAELALGMAVALWVGPANLWWGHPIEVLIPLLWLKAGSYVSKGHWLRGGVALGLTPAIAPWAAVALPMTFVGKVKPALAMCVATAVSVAIYLPFMLSGHFQLFHHVWPIGSHTLAHLVMPGATTFGWPMRFVQAALAAVGCLLVARWRRIGVDARWAAPLIGVLLRILLDPITQSYYWTPAAVLVVAGTMMRTAATRWQLIGFISLGYLVFLGAALARPVYAGLACLAVLLVLTAAGARSRSGQICSNKYLVVTQS